MSNIFPIQFRRTTFGFETFIGIAVVISLLLYSLLLFPESLEHGEYTNFLITATALLVYGLISFWVYRTKPEPLRLSLSQGARLGVLLGVIEIINHSLETFASLDQSISAILGVSMWGLMFLVFGSVGSAIYKRFSSFRLSIISSIWCALVSTVMILLFGFLTSLIFMSRYEEILNGDFIQSGLSNPKAFVILNTINSAASHVILAPLTAVLFGFGGGLAFKILGSIQKKIAIVFAASDLLLVVVGVWSIQLANSLSRSDRPPFILVGLVSIGIAMVCIYPIFSALKTRKS